MASTLHDTPRMCRLMIVLALACVPALAGCTDWLCNGDVVEETHWVGDGIAQPRISAAGNTTLAVWADGLRFHSAAIAGRYEVGPEHELELDVLDPIRQIASAPTGHLLLSGKDESSLTALLFDANGVPGASLHPSTGLVKASSAVFDGTNFLIAWTEGDALNLSSIAPGGTTTSAPITLRNGLAPSRIVMASSGGVTWLVWAEEGRALGIRVTSGGATDPTPVLLLQDPRIPAPGWVDLASSNGRFLLEVYVEPGAPLLVPFDAPPNGPPTIGATVESPANGIAHLVGEPDGFAFLRRAPSSTGPATFVVVRLAPDGTYLRESSYTGIEADLASDDGGLLLALSTTSTLGDEGRSVLSLEAVAGGGQVEIVTHELSRETTSSCAEDPAY